MQEGAAGASELAFLVKVKLSRGSQEYAQSSRRGSESRDFLHLSENTLISSSRRLCTGSKALQTTSMGLEDGRGSACAQDVVSEQGTEVLDVLW
jgi:hypothetical protein